MINDAIIWVIAAAILGIVEVSTVNLITLWFAVSAVVAAVFAACGAAPGVQIAVFIVVSAILVIATRPLAKRFLNRNTVATNADRIISAKGVVIEEINSVKGSGQVKVMGQVWSAKSVNGENIADGTSVTIVALEGAKVVVSA
jgi:membrane protein implicated in regulation of membrane protease activity